MIAQANSKFSPLNTNNHQINLLESPGDHNTLFGLSNFNKLDNLHSSHQLRLGGVQSTSASGNGMFGNGNGNEISPLYRKREVQLLIGGNIDSPQININGSQANLNLNHNNNWSAAPSGGPSLQEELNEAQSFSTLAKIWKQNNNTDSPLMSQGDHSPQTIKQHMLNMLMNPRGVGSENSAFKKGSRHGSVQGITYIQDHQLPTPNLVSQ